MSRPASPRPRLRAALLCITCLTTVAATSACSSPAPPVVKANGCTAVTTGTAQGRKVVTYLDATGDPTMSSAITAAAATWNAAPIPVLLKPVKAGATITIVAASSRTETGKCTTSNKVRTSVIYLSSNSWHGTGGKLKTAMPARQVAVEFGHALGLTDVGSCQALMTKKSCSSYASKPSTAEAAQITKLYH